MNLEDHAGDVVFKARNGLGVSTSRVATVAGLGESDLEAWEETGKPGHPPDFEALAGLLELDPEKFRRVAEGWVPNEAAPERWPGVRCFETRERMAVNAYLVWDLASGKGVLFDTGWTVDPVVAFAKERGITIQHLCLTHGHGDHVADIAGLCGAFPRVQLHSAMAAAPANQRLSEGESLEVGPLQVAWRSTPGHAPDGVTYVVTGFPDQLPPVAVVGDALFAGSMGGAPKAWNLARDRVRSEILSLPPETLICPGHGPCSTVALERANNPFFRD